MKIGVVAVFGIDTADRAGSCASLPEHAAAPAEQHTSGHHAWESTIREFSNYCRRVGQMRLRLIVGETRVR